MKFSVCSDQCVGQKYLQENALDFIYDAYHNESGNISVPDSLRMEKDISSHREASELKAYRAKNRYYLQSSQLYNIWALLYQIMKCANNSFFTPQFTDILLNVKIVLMFWIG